MIGGLFRDDALAGRRAFVTGGAQGIGAAIVRLLQAMGAQVVFVDRNEEAGTALAAQTGASFRCADLLDFPWVAQTVAETGPFDILVNNVGLDQHAFFTDTAPGDWDMLIGINLKSMLATTHACLPHMQKAGFGRIICIASEAARRGSRGGSVYAAAKGGVIAFTKSIAQENARFAITANVICPGPVRTPLLERAVAKHGGEKLEQAMIGATLLRRLGTPEEVASMVGYLASDQAGFITAEVIGVSGGMGC